MITTIRYLLPDEWSDEDIAEFAQSSAVPGVECARWSDSFSSAKCLATEPAPPDRGRTDGSLGGGVRLAGDEIEVTPEMEEVGSDVLVTYDPQVARPEDYAAEIYRAMEGKRRKMLGRLAGAVLAVCLRQDDGA
jgi:hypothetical protein